MMADRKLFSMTDRGAAANEPLTLHFSNLTLPEALAKMMRGYNYVLVYEDKGRLPVLTLMGKAERAASAPDRPADYTAPAAKNRGEPGEGPQPEATPAPQGGSMPPAQPRPPLAPPQPRENSPSQAPGGQQAAVQSPQAGGQAAGQQAATPSSPQGAGQQPTFQPPAPGAQVQPAQQAPGAPQAPNAQAQPQEPEGVHF